MDISIAVALIGMGGSIIGTLGGILITNRLTTYRLKKLEEKVELHNNLVERMTKAETRIDNIDEKVDDLKVNLGRFLK